MSTLIVESTGPIEARCCWCRKPFVLETILGELFWICETPSCFDRQCRWAIFSPVDRRLFHLPTPKNVELEEAVESQQYRHILIGGSRGGAKSTALRRLAYRYCMQFEDFTAVLLRRTLKDLEKDHLLKAHREMKRLGARLASHKVTWPDRDSLLTFGHCQDPDDWKNWVGGEADLLIIDQAEMFLEKQVTEIPAILGRNRRPDWRGVALYGENPGGPLAEYIDEVFIAQTRDRTKYPGYKPEQYAYIPTQVEDNPWVDAEYSDFLNALEPAQRARFRWGRRDVFPGQYFPDFASDTRVQTLEAPPTLLRIGGLHWGYFRPGLFVWAVVLPDGRLYVERELPFEEQLADEVARQVAAVNERQHWTWAGVWGNPPSDIPEGQTGEDVFDTFRARGVPVLRSDHDRVSGFLRLRHWFNAITIEGVTQSALIVSPACPTLIKTIPTLIQDPTHEEDCSRQGHEQGANALRYIVMSRPEPPVIAPPPRGRDLSQLPPKIAQDILRLRDYEEHDPSNLELKIGDPGWPFGPHWGGSSSIVD